MTTVAQARDTSAPVNYRFGTGAPAGVWLGLGLSRVAILAGALVTTTVLLALRVGLPISLCPLLVGVAVTFVQVGGRPLCGWITPVAGHAPAVAAGSTRWAAPLP